MFASNKRIEYVRAALLALCGKFGNAMVFTLDKLEGEALAAEITRAEGIVRFVLTTAVEGLTARYEAVVKPLETSFAVIEKAMVEAGAKVPNATKNAHFAPAAASWRAKEAAEAELRDSESRLADLDRLEAQIVARAAKKTGTDA